MENNSNQWFEKCEEDSGNCVELKTMIRIRDNPYGMNGDGNGTIAQRSAKNIDVIVGPNMHHDYFQNVYANVHCPNWQNYEGILGNARL
uniref:Peptidase S1 domain-containing protein n=1 Tax=Ascaris lumbricoides TaxID=6252 RepID=A0A0M3IIM0_ASCLU